MRIPSLVALLLFVACGLVACGPVEPSGGAPDAGSQADAGDGAFVPGAPITAPAETWTYVPFPEAKCGNGTETGIGVSLRPGAKTLVVLLQGGGACWEAGACYILKTATHVEDVMQETTVLAESRAAGGGLLFNRSDAENPLRDAHQVYVPYCTGDLHAGTRVQRYEAFGQTRDLHHVGAINMDAYLKRLVPTAAGVERVVLAGISAGGLGTLFHWWRFQEAFGPDVRVDVLNDSGDPVQMAWDRFGTLSVAWAPAWPPDCADCRSAGFHRLLPYYATKMPPPQRLGLLSFRDDGVISAYFGIPAADVRRGLDTLKAGASANQKLFLLDGTGHVVAAEPSRATSTGQTARSWIFDFLTNDAGWDHAGP